MIPRSREQLQRAFDAAADSPIGTGSVILVVVRKGGGRHETPQGVLFDPVSGVAGDRWGGAPRRKIGRQVTLIEARVARALAPDGAYDRSGDNLVVDLALAEHALEIGARLQVGPALLEITPVPHRGCKTFAMRFGRDAQQWVAHPDNVAHRLRGVHARVVNPGLVSVGDPVEIIGHSEPSSDG